MSFFENWSFQKPQISTSHRSQSLKRSIDIPQELPEILHFLLRLFERQKYLTKLRSNHLLLLESSQLPLNRLSTASLPPFMKLFDALMPITDKWIAAMISEIDSIVENKTWTLVYDLPAIRKCIGTKWVFKIKLDGNNNIERYKCRIVAKGSADILTKSLGPRKHQHAIGMAGLFNVY